MSLRLLGTLLLLAAARAQQTTSLVPSDAFACFTTVEGALLVTRVAVQGPGFTQAFHLKTLNASTNPWDTRLRCFNTLAAKQNDTVLATFWMRTTASQTGEGLTTFVVEKGADPWTKSASWTAMAKSDWKKVEVPFSMLETYGNAAGAAGANTYNLSFWANFSGQQIEIGGFSILDYGQNIPFSSLNLTTWPYEGRAADAPWRAAADDRIERIRKSDLSVVVKDDQGNPIAGSPVHVRMKRHAFGFGSAVAGQMLMQAGADQANYRQNVLAMFNKAVLENDLKWPPWEENWGWALPALDWLRSNGITDIRGHNLIWPGLDYLPADVVTMLSATPVNAQALRDRIHNHFIDELTKTNGKLTEWDVVNEPVVNRVVQNVLGDAEMVQWYKWARELAPGAKLFVNDYNILEAGGNDIQHQDAYYNIIKFLIDGGAPLDGIGLQSHFDPNLTAPDRVLEVLDRFAAFGKDLEVTEFDINIADEKVQADYTRDFLTTCFSHLAIKGFLMWGFWEGAHWAPQAALLREDWSHKLNYDAWMDTIYKKWWTDVQGTTDSYGVFHTRAFLGDYEVDAGGQTLALQIAGGQPNYATSGNQTLPTFTADGVVNAASFQKGAIAPGEIVEIWGQDFGSQDLVTGTYDFGQLRTYGGDMRVLFDGVPAPLIHSLRNDPAGAPRVGRVAAVVPYGVSAATNVQVEYLGQKSDAVAVPVAAAAPGIFCYAGGAGQAVAVNVAADGTRTFNDPGHPAAKGDYLEIYITGEGSMTPAIADGKLPLQPNPKPALPVVVKIGGAESKAADCPYNWVGLTYAGVTQIDACIPRDAQSGIVPLEITVGGVAAQRGVSVAVK